LLKRRSEQLVGDLASGLTVAASTSTTATGGRLVEVAGRSLYLECVGTGAPTLLLQSGYGNAGDIWSGTDAGPPPLAAGLATTNRACVYDRPGTIRTLDDNGAALTTPLPGRSEQTPMPRTGTEVAALPGSKLEVVADASHYIQVERPAVVIQAARSVSS
jgi:pimeloyl-ACP methyl ester carboxylesterase